ncbi:MAG: GIY-YIG nuclease family protein [Bacteroidales bacterium]|nr:GIY-YIG nuclease family protein [Bacteroidales bacterium]
MYPQSKSYGHFYICLDRPLDSHLVRYVGKTTDPYKRENEHKNRKGRADKDKWIESLKEQGKMPNFHILEICDDTNWHKR